MSEGQLHEEESGLRAADSKPSSPTARGADEPPPEADEPKKRHPSSEPKLAAKIATPIGLIGATAILLYSVHVHYPIQEWIVWKYVKVWAYLILWAVSGLSAGYAVVRRLFSDLPRSEQVVHASAVGAYLLFLGTFLLGVVGAIHPVAMVALPVVLLGVGARDLLELARQAREIYRAPRPKLSWLGWAIVGFGFLYLCLMYLAILSPKNVAFDTRMYHLGLAEGWAATGKIEPSAEGWFVETLPQLTSILFTWAQAVPGLDYFEHIELAAHIEYALFLWTLFGVAVLTRWLVPDSDRRLTWAAMFLFPSIYVYDAGLHSGSDHVAAFFAAPAGLAMVRSFELKPRVVSLLAFMMGCAILVKYQAVSIVVGPILVVAYYVLRAIVRQLRRRPAPKWYLAAGLAIAVGLITTAPHWLKNFIWHGDPLYPALHKRFDVRPWGPGAEESMANTWKKLKGPEGTLPEKLKQTTLEFGTYAFKRFTYKRFHGDRPIFGALFTLSIAWLPFVRRSRRTWLFVVLGHLGVFVWYYLSHVERYLQVLVPWMAAVVAAALLLAWRTGLFARIAVAVLVLAQVVWGGDAIFFPTHGVNRGKSGLEMGIDLIGNNLKERNRERRGEIFGSLQDVGDALPEDAVVLLHEFNPRLGLRTEVVSDMPNNQGAISYGYLDSAGAVYDLYRELGVTHIVWRRSSSRGLDSIGSDVRFFELAEIFAENHQRKGSWSYAELPDERPDRAPAEMVLSLGCSRYVAAGLVPFERLRSDRIGKRDVARPLPKSPEEIAELVDSVNVVVTTPGCQSKLPAEARNQFLRTAKRKDNGLTIWVRKDGP